MAAGSLLRRTNDQLAALLDMRRRVDAEMRPTRVEARNPDGTLQLRRLDGECSARGPVCGLYVGQVVDAPCAAPWKLSGAAGIGMAREHRAAATMAVTAIEPSLFDPGASLTVTITGLGFLPISVFEFLVPGTEDLNDDITVDEIRYISDTECEVDITVAADAAVIAAETGDIAFDNPGEPL